MVHNLTSQNRILTTKDYCTNIGLLIVQQSYEILVSQMTILLPMGYASMLEISGITKIQLQPQTARCAAHGVFKPFNNPHSAQQGFADLLQYLVELQIREEQDSNFVLYLSNICQQSLQPFCELYNNVFPLHDLHKNQPLHCIS